MNKTAKTLQGRVDADAGGVGPRPRLAGASSGGVDPGAEVLLGFVVGGGVLDQVGLDLRLRVRAVRRPRPAAREEVDTHDGT